MYNNSVLKSTSEATEINNLNFLNKSIYLGSGSAQDFDQFKFLPVETMNANLDEFRFWKSARNKSLINTFYQENVFQNDDLAMYYRFNEPTGSYASKAFVLDHSGNGIHGQVSSYTDSMRGSKEQSQLPVIYEKLQNSPVLFPDYVDLITINSDLLTTVITLTVPFLEMEKYRRRKSYPRFCLYGLLSLTK